MDEASNDRNCEDVTEPLPKKSKLEKPALEDNILLKHIDDPELLRLYKTNWRHIRSSVKKKKLLTTYNCFLPTLNTESIVKCVEEVFEEQKNAFKLQVSFGFILWNHENRETNNDYISEFISAGSKNYAYKLKNSETASCKEVTLNWSASQKNPILIR